MRIVDQLGFVARPNDRRRAIRSQSFLAAPGRDLIESGAPCLGQVLDVLPFVLDVLTERREGFEGVARALDRGIDGVRNDLAWFDGRHARRLARGRRSPPERPAARAVMAGDRPIGPADQPEEANTTVLVPGIGISRGRGHPDPPRLDPLADLLEPGDAVEDITVETGKIVRRRRRRFDGDRG